MVPIIKYQIQRHLIGGTTPFTICTCHSPESAGEVIRVILTAEGASPGTQVIVNQIREWLPSTEEVESGKDV